MDTFSWRGREIWCAETAGNSPGSMTYLLRQGGAGDAKVGWLAFTGDLMLDGAVLHTWFDSEWDYGFCKGIYTLATAAGYLEGFTPLTMLPAHGPPIRDAAPQLATFQQKLRRLDKVMKRGWEVFTFAGCDQDRISRPTAVPHLWQVSPHLYKVRGHEYWPNFHMLVSDDGHALLVDCGLFDRKHLDRVLDGARDRLGIKKIDAILVTHMHGDHFLDVPTVYEIKIVAPPGVRFEPSAATLRVEPCTVRRLPVQVSAAGDATAGLALAAIDITHDGLRRGQVFDAIVNVA